MIVSRARALRSCASAAELEPLVWRRMPYPAAAWLLTGTGEDKGLRRNLEGFDKVQLVPRRLTGVALQEDLSVDFLGTRYAAPFGIAPMGASSLLWPGAEQSLASVATEHRIPYCLSGMDHHGMGKVKEWAGEMGWFQYYATRNRELGAAIVDRAERCGYSTLVYTVDLPVGAPRQTFEKALGKVRAGNPIALWKTFARPYWISKMLWAGATSTLLSILADKEPREEILEFVPEVLTWASLEDLRKRWKGKLLVKGVLYPEDAKRCLECGADGVWVSNHGGRQFDGAPSTMDVLPNIREAVGNDSPIILDSGVRSGTDVVKALARGADFVMLGRAFMFGLIAFGPKGGQIMFDLIACQVRDALAQLGVASLADLRKLGPL